MMSSKITMPITTHQTTSVLVGMDEILAWAKILKTYHYPSPLR